VPKTMPRSTLTCWLPSRDGVGRIRDTLELLRRRGHPVQLVWLLHTTDHGPIPETIHGAIVEPIPTGCSDPTDNHAIFEAVREHILVGRLPWLKGRLHVEISHGAHATHAAWLLHYVAGEFGREVQLWKGTSRPAVHGEEVSAQDFVNEAGFLVGLQPATFPIDSLHSVARSAAAAAPGEARYDLKPRSPLRRAAFMELGLAARCRGLPILILGERGTGKTRLVEGEVKAWKGVDVVTPISCGSLEEKRTESDLFGHVKGAFTGADSDKVGLIEAAGDGIVFLDEVQDLLPPVQRKLLRVLEGGRYRRLGDTVERETSAEFIFASNLSFEALQSRLAPDLFDRISGVVVEIPPLRDCREDLLGDWRAVWKQLRRSDDLPDEAPTPPALRAFLQTDPLPGNLRDLQKLAYQVMFRWGRGSEEEVLREAIAARARWARAAPAEHLFGPGKWKDREHNFKRALARWAVARYGSPKAAASALVIGEKTVKGHLKEEPGADG